MKSIHVSRALDNPLDRLRLSTSERRRAEVALRRGEYLADLVLRGISFFRNAINGIGRGLRGKTSSCLGSRA